MDNILQKFLSFIHNNFSQNTSKMLIVTGTIGLILSAIAQLCAIYKNKEITNEKKSFLLPQEAVDGTINILSFLFITLFVKKAVSKLVKTGKIAPSTVREFLNKNKNLYGDKIGKLDFNLDNIITKEGANSKYYKSYASFKNTAETVSTVGATVLASNVITPILRNAAAAKVQNNYINLQHNNNYSTYGNVAKI